MVISLRSSLEMVPRIKFLVKIERENQFQSSEAEAGDSHTYASFGLRILSLDEFPDNISWVTVKERRRETVGRNKRRRDSFSISLSKSVSPHINNVIFISTQAQTWVICIPHSALTDVIESAKFIWKYSLDQLKWSKFYREAGRN